MLNPVTGLDNTASSLVGGKGQNKSKNTAKDAKNISHEVDSCSIFFTRIQRMKTELY